MGLFTWSAPDCFAPARSIVFLWRAKMPNLIAVLPRTCAPSDFTPWPELKVQSVSTLTLLVSDLSACNQWVDSCPRYNLNDLWWTNSSFTAFHSAQNCTTPLENHTTVFAGRLKGGYLPETSFLRWSTYYGKWTALAWGFSAWTGQSASQSISFTHSFAHSHTSGGREGACSATRSNLGFSVLINTLTCGEEVPGIKPQTLWLMILILYLWVLFFYLAHIDVNLSNTVCKQD